MKLISWNIDGAKSILRRTNFMSTLMMWNADIFAFQETKLSKPDLRIKFPGYHDYWSFHDNCTTASPQSGTVCFTREKARKFYTSIEGADFDTEGRIITLEFDHYFFINCYVPQSQDAVTGANKAKSVDRNEYRLKWDRLLREYICDLDKKKPVIVCGDFNASISPLDMSEKSVWQDDEGGFSKDVNSQLRKLVESGFTDTYRYLHPKEKNAFTHWSLKDNDRETGSGRRLDYFFVSNDLAEKIESAEIYPRVTGSDHCPILLKIDLSQPILRNDITVNLTYDDLLQREKTKVYFNALKTADLSTAWNTVDWNRAQNHLAAMQCSLAKAAYVHDDERIKDLQYKIVTSLDAKLLAVRSVASRKGQPGIDGVKWETSNEKAHAAISLTSKNYNAKPARLVIQKRKNKKDRNVHVDTYYDRAMQTLYGYSLAPIAESLSDRKSFCNRKFRSPLDVNYYICKIFSGNNAPEWAVKTDVKKCYESLDHSWIRAHIPMAKRVLDEFLSAGYFLSDKYYETDQGIGIGSRLSPYIANMSMDGLQDYLYEKLNPGAGDEDIDYGNGNMVRFADDIIISARTKESAVLIRKLIRDFMAERGLTLSDEKTDIIFIPKGFDFMNRAYEKHGDYLIASPSKATVTTFKNKIGRYISNYKGSSQNLIDELNLKIIGFVSLHKMTDAMDAFKDIDGFIRLCILKLCEERYQLTRDKALSIYFRKDFKNRLNYFVKSAPHKQLLFMADTIMTTYRPIPLHMNPYIDFEEIDMLTEIKAINNATKKYKKIWNRQEGMCELCKLLIRPDDDRDLFEVDPTAKNFDDRMAYIHSRCKGLFFEYEDIKEPEYPEDDKTKELIMEMSKDYEIEDLENHPLYQFFKNCDRKTITLSFKKIGEILGSPLSEIANHREFWIQDGENKLSRCWLDNGYTVRKFSIDGRRAITFQKRVFSGETAKVYLPDILLHGEVSVRMKHQLESAMKNIFELNGLSWE